MHIQGQGERREKKDLKHNYIFSSTVLTASVFLPPNNGKLLPTNPNSIRALATREKSLFTARTLEPTHCFARRLNNNNKPHRITRQIVPL